MNAEQAVLAEMHVESRRRQFARVAAAVTMLAVALGFLVFSRQRTGDRWIVLAVIACCAGGLFVRRPLLLLAVCGLASAGLTAFSASPQLVPTVGGGGMHCAAVEVLAALAPFVCLLAAMAINRDPIRATTLAAVAATGALAGQAALVVACSASEDATHVVMFHNGGFVLSSISLALLAVAASEVSRRRALRIR